MRFFAGGSLRVPAYRIIRWRRWSLAVTKRPVFSSGDGSAELRTAGLLVESRV